MNSFRPCALIPTYDNPLTIQRVVERVRASLLDVIVVDDGSAEPGKAAVSALGEAGLVQVVHRPRNGGKGAAVKHGLRVAHELGYSHALQLDADGQHDEHQIPEFLAAARAMPEALILGRPVFDESAPESRRRGRLVSRFFTDLEAGRRIIADPLCGFRVYPLEAVHRVRVAGNRMDFDIEVAVKLVWAGCPVVNIPTLVRYLSPSEGGVSHFHLFEDNVRISWCHTRLCAAALVRAILRRR